MRSPVLVLVSVGVLVILLYGVWTTTKKNQEVIKCPPSVTSPSIVVKTSSSTSPSSISSISEAFICFVTSSNYALLPVYLDSIHLFSTRSVVVFCIGCDATIDSSRHPRAVSRSIPRGAGHSVFYNKILCAATALQWYDRVAYVEPDSVVNYRIDDVWQWLEEWKDLSYPLLPRHPDNPGDQSAHMQDLSVKSPTMRYGHAHLLFTRNSLSFFLQTFWHSQVTSVHGANWDETLLNVALWKHGATQQACLYDPYGAGISNSNVQAYLTSSTLPWKSSQPLSAVAMHVLHGIKDPGEQSRVLQLLKEAAKKKLPVYWDLKQSKWVHDWRQLQSKCVETGMN